LTVLLLFAQCKMHCWWLVLWLDWTFPWTCLHMAQQNKKYLRKIKYSNWGRKIDKVGQVLTRKGEAGQETKEAERKWCTLRCDYDVDLSKNLWRWSNTKQCSLSECRLMENSR
jgi:hypothetical protein